MSKQDAKFLIFYGSQTGQSEAISKILVDKCQQLGLDPELYQLNDFQDKVIITRTSVLLLAPFFLLFQVNLKTESIIIIVCSTTGDADPPDNAAHFVRWISRHVHPENLLHLVHYAILGLGDSNYNSYQAIPNLLNKHFQRLGAHKFFRTGAADDQAGLELVVEPWLDEIIPILINYFQPPAEHLKKVCISGSPVIVYSSNQLDPEQRNPTNLPTLSLNSSNIMSDQERMSVDGDRGSAEEPNKEDIEDEEEEFEEPEEPEEPILKPVKFVWPVGLPSLVNGTEKTVGQQLRVPTATTTYLASTLTHEKFDCNTANWQNGHGFLGTNNVIYKARVVGTMELTKPNAKKVKREIYVDIGDAITEIDYEPGDAFYFIVPNFREEVNLILERMNLLSVADQKCYIRIHPRTEKRNASKPGYIPEISSLRYVFTYCLDIRRPPSRPLIRWLAEQTKDEAEKRRLLELCSVEGAEEFTQFVQKAGLSLADILFAFPSCRPSADRLIELLPRLQPRAYSVVSTKARWGSRLRFVYSLMSFPAADGRYYQRFGLASGWLSTLKIGDTVQIMYKKPGKFRFSSLDGVSDVQATPLIMIGPGTGVAPFISFLEKIFDNNLSDGKDASVERELYFGCRDLNVDCIFKNEMEFYKRQKILTHLSICESQPNLTTANVKPKYVQDALVQRGKHIADLLTRTLSEGQQKTRVYVCGDAKEMSKDVWETFIKIITDNTGRTEEQAKQFMEEFKTENRYVEDVWV
uniref:Methionine synthase reductase n=1 Tax=Syphacia muris TaxID=451379 RepID=A0A0N5ANG9_9BILA